MASCLLCAGSFPVPACNEVHLLRYFTWVDFFTFYLYEVQFFETTCNGPYNEVHLGGNFRNVTKYRCLLFKMLKVIHFSAVNCDLCFYSLLQIIVASPAKLCSIKVADNLWFTSIAFSWHPPNARGSIHSALLLADHQSKIAAVAAVTISCQVSQANVGCLIIGFLSECLLLLIIILTVRTPRATTPRATTPRLLLLLSQGSNLNLNWIEFYSKLAGYPASLGTLPLSPPSHSSLPSTLPPSDYQASTRIFAVSSLKITPFPRYFLKVDA